MNQSTSGLIRRAAGQGSRNPVIHKMGGDKTLVYMQKNSFSVGILSYFVLSALRNRICINNLAFRIHDTTGLNDGESGRVPSKEAIIQLFKLLRGVRGEFLAAPYPYPQNSRPATTGAGFPRNSRRLS